MVLVGEQQVMHLPELALPSGTFRCLSGTEGMRMRLLQRKVPESEPHAAGETLEQQLHRRLRLFAVRAFEVAVLDHGGDGMRRSDHVIDCAEGDCKLERNVRFHDTT